MVFELFFIYSFIYLFVCLFVFFLAWQRNLFFFFLNFESYHQKSKQNFWNIKSWSQFVVATVGEQFWPPNYLKFSSCSSLSPRDYNLRIHFSYYLFVKYSIMYFNTFWVTERMQSEM